MFSILSMSAETLTIFSKQYEMLVSGGILLNLTDGLFPKPSG